MSLRKKNGKWEYRFSLPGFGRVSRTTDLAATESNKKKAARLETEHRRSLLGGAVPARPVHKTRFVRDSEEFSVWLDSQHKESTARRVKTSLASLREFFASNTTGSITAADLEEYKHWRITECGVKPITLRHDLDNLSKFFSWANRMKRAESNPVAEVAKPSDQDAIRIHVLTDDEENHYFAQAARSRGTPLYDVARLILLCGFCPEEVLEAEKSNVDLERGTLFVPKGKRPARRRTVKLVGEAADIVKQRMPGSSRWLFPSSRIPGRPVASVQTAHDSVCEKIGAYFVIYDLRHTFATRAAQNGVDLPTLAAILNHGSLRMVTRYVHPAQQHQDAAMEKLEELRQAKESSPPPDEAEEVSLLTRADLISRLEQWRSEQGISSARKLQIDPRNS